MDRMRVHPLAELCIKAVDEATIAELNEQWMEKEGPTDVLAFPMDELRPGLVNEEPEEGVLGDLVLCPAVAERQGETAGHGTDAEIELLTVHGILHLLGYDHAEPEEHRRCSACRTSCWRSGGPSARDERPVDVWLLVTAAVLVVLAGLFSAADAALASFSRARAEELPATSARAGARRLVGAARGRRPATSTPRSSCGCSARSPRSCWSPAGPIAEAVDGVWLGAVLGTVDRRHAGRVVRGDRRRPAHPGPPARRARSRC